jgi:hypothetical protein
MPEPYLADAIMQGLHPELRLLLLHSKAETVEEIIEAARVSEVAHSANTTSASQMETLTAKVDLLLTNMVANKNEESTTAPKKVTFRLRKQWWRPRQQTDRTERDRTHQQGGLQAGRRFDRPTVTNRRRDHSDVSGQTTIIHFVAKLTVDGR